jgi:hypothetical protein
MRDGSGNPIDLFELYQGEAFYTPREIGRMVLLLLRDVCCEG